MNAKSVIAVLAVAGALAVPVLAETTAPDPAKLTCKELLAMDSAGMTTVAQAVKTAMKDDAKVQAMSEADLTKALGDHCKGHDADTVLAAFKM